MKDFCGEIPFGDSRDTSPMVLFVDARPTIVPPGTEYAGGPQPDELLVDQAAETIRPDSETIAARDLGSTSVEALCIDEPRVEPVETIRRFEVLGYVEEAPDFTMQAQDQTRLGLITAQPGGDKCSETPEELITVTEHEALEELRGFLKGHDDNSIARGMLQGTSFMGEKEMNEGTGGLAQYSTSFLDADDRNQLCLVAPLGKDGEYKSPTYVLNKLLEHIDDERLEAYARSGRLVIRPDAISGPAEHVRFSLVDDAAVTGGYAKDAINDLKSNLAAEYHNCIEANFVVAASLHVDNGIFLGKDKGWVPTKAYYRAHEVLTSKAYRAHIAMAHATPIPGMLHQIRGIAAGHKLPALVRVSKPYADPNWRPVRLEWFLSLSRANR
jgi:hypothetical protein